MKRMVKIRLTRMGRRNRPFFRLVVVIHKSVQRRGHIDFLWDSMIR